MTHLIDPDQHYAAGESITWEFTVEDPAGNAKDLSGASVEWYLLPNRGAADADALEDHTSTGISASVADAANGRVDVAIEQDVTTDYAGDTLWHRLIVDDSGTGKQVWGGTFPVHES